MAEPTAAGNVRPSSARWARLRPAASRLATGLAFAAVWLALILPNRLDQLHPGVLLQIPAEGLGLVLLALLPARPRRLAAALLGAAATGWLVRKPAAPSPGGVA